MKVHAKVLFLSAALVLILSTSDATAGTISTYQQVSSFDGSGTPAGSFTPSKIAIHQSTGTIYVLDPDRGLVDKFDSSGNPEDFSALVSPSLDGSGAPLGPFSTVHAGVRDLQAIAVDNSGGPFDGDIYVADGPVEDGRVSAFDPAGNFLYEFDPSATSTGGFDRPGGLAVDSAGAVFVSGFDASTLRKFVPNGTGAELESEISLAEAGITGLPADLAIDSGDNIYVNGVGSEDVQNVSKLSSSGAFNSQVLNRSVRAFAVNPSTDHLYVDPSNAVTEYDSSGTELTRFGLGTIGSSSGIAVDTSGTIYVADSQSASVRVFVRGDVTVPDVTIGAASEPGATSAALNGTVDPLGVPSSFHFEYRIQGQSEWLSTPEQASLEAGGGPQDVSAEITRLEPGSTYEVRLIAANTEVGAANGAIETSGVVTFTTDAAAPTLLTSPAAVATTNAATLYADLIPHGPGTIYRFEYGTDSSYGTTVPVPDGSVGGGTNSASVPHSVSDLIGGLDPSTIYHFRLVASNSAGTTTGIDRTFKTADEKPEIGLPDGRVYEKVTPDEKGGANVERANFHVSGLTRRIVQVSVAGDAVVWASRANFGADSGALMPQYISHRTASGWSPRPLTPRNLSGLAGATSTQYLWFSDDLSRGAVSTYAQLLASAPPKPDHAPFLYMRDTTASNDDANSAYTLLSIPSIPIPENEHLGQLAFWPLGASSDLSHILFATDMELLPEGHVFNEGSSSGLYEWVSGQIRYVGILPDGTPAVGSAAGSAASTYAHPSIRETYPGDNVISDDGSRAFFGDANCSNCYAEHLYVRENGATTTKLGTNARFQAAKASDGSVSFFTSLDKLTADATANFLECGTREFGCADLYRWDSNAVSGEELSDLTTADLGGAGVLGTAGISDDASAVYFVATGDLAPGAVGGAPNLYLWRENQEIRHIATLSTETNSSGFYLDSNVWGRFFSPEMGGNQYGGARVTPSGKQLLFESRVQLTPYDNAGRQQLYLYDTPTDQITCISCNRRATSSSGKTAFSLALEAPGRVGSTGPGLPRNLSADGRRAFFETTEALLPEDTDGKVDVYEWSEGTLHLISTGAGGTDSTFIGAGGNGDDAFFVTGQALTRSDGDDLLDIYDAKVDGTSEPSPIPACNGDECQGTPLTPPIFNDLGSATYRGPPQGRAANPHKRCGKGRHARNRRCVRKRHLKKQATRRQG